MLGGSRSPARIREHALAAADRRQEADAVAAEVVEESPVAWVRADDADPAVHVAHQPVPVEVVRAARAGRAGWANGRTCRVHAAAAVSPGKGACRVARLVDRVLRAAHAGERDRAVGRGRRSAG